MLVLVVVTDLLFKSKIIETAQAVSGDIVLATGHESALDVAHQLHPDKAIVDLNEKEFDALKTIKELKQKNAGLTIIGFVSHVQRELQAHAKLAGCDDIMPRSEFVRKLPDLLVQ
ncbi:hypothetical protein HY492_03620 [Candidatus Woesearchaeota archaeon]|nr:hypothetical protein [Candidatus Woesearchaeota archaeon]